MPLQLPNHWKNSKALTPTRKKSPTGLILYKSTNWLQLSQLTNASASCTLTKPITKLEKIAFDQGWTDRISLTQDVDLNLWSWTSISCKLRSWPTHTQKFKVNGQSVQKTEWKQTDKWTDRRTDGGDCITCRINAVYKRITQLNTKITTMLVNDISTAAVPCSQVADHCGGLSVVVPTSA